MHSKRTATPAKAGKLHFAHKHLKLPEVGKLPSLFKGGAHRPARSSVSQRASAWHAYTHLTTPS